MPNAQINPNVQHPKHYNLSKYKTKAGEAIECIDVVRHMTFNLGNVVKYLWRAGHKNDLLEDLEKAYFYLGDEIQELKAKK